MKSASYVSLHAPFLFLKRLLIPAYGKSEFDANAAVSLFGGGIDGKVVRESI